MGTRSRRTVKRKRTSKRPFNMSRRKVRANTLSTKRFVIKQIIGGSDATPGGVYAWTFNLQDVPAYSEFVNLFEEFKIAGIAYRWIVNRDTNQSTGTNDGFYPRLMWVHDHTDSSVPANFAELQQYPKVNEVWLSPNRQSTKWYYFKPNTIDVGYTSGVVSNYGINYKRWIDTGTSGAPYYGMKLVYDALYAGLQVFLECKYYLRFRGPK